MNIPNLEFPKDHLSRMKVVREYCEWELGDPDWAEYIIRAYFYTKETKEYLEREKAG